MAQIPLMPISPPAPAAPINASQGGDQYQNDGSALLLVFNDSASPIVVTRLVQTQPDEPDACEDSTVSCTANSLMVLPPVSPRRFNDLKGNVQVRYPNGTAGDIRVFVIAVPPER